MYFLHLVPTFPHDIVVEKGLLSMSSLEPRASSPRFNLLGCMPRYNLGEEGLGSRLGFE